MRSIDYLIMDFFDNYKTAHDKLWELCVRLGQEHASGRALYEKLEKRNGDWQKGDILLIGEQLATLQQENEYLKRGYELSDEELFVCQFFSAIDRLLSSERLALSGLGA